MSKLDDAINAALTDEDERLLEHAGSEPGYLKQAFGMFKGRLGWVMVVAFGGSLLAFGFCLYALIQLVEATESIMAIKWGVATIAGLQINIFLRGFMGSHFEANRLLREFRKLELRVLRG